MKKTLFIEVLTTISVALLILLFTYTAISKVIENEKFVFQMGLSPFPLMKTFAPLLVWLVPFIEVVIVGALLLAKYRRAGLKASLILLGIFEIYIGAMMLSIEKLPCTCGGIISQMGWGQHLIFNAVFMVLAWLALRGMNRKWPFYRLTINT